MTNQQVPKVEHLDRGIFGYRVVETSRAPFDFPEVRTDGDHVDMKLLELALGEMVDIGKERYGLTWPGKADSTEPFKHRLWLRCCRCRKKVSLLTRRLT